LPGQGILTEVDASCGGKLRVISSIEDLPVIVWMLGNVGGDDETGRSWLAIGCASIDQTWR
jgi:hypothetical protein